MAVIPKNIFYGTMLYESLRNYYSVNKAGELTWLFKFCAACVAVMQNPFTDYYNTRQINLIVAGCMWQIGQLTNVLNYIYDPSLSRIFITQSTSLLATAPEFASTSPINVPEFTYQPTTGLQVFGSAPRITEVIFNVPVALIADIPSIEATIAQVALTGIPYIVQTF